MARQNLTEAGAHTEILETNSDGSLLVQIITPGWGSSGYYSNQVLEAAAKDKVWPKGTHMYFDHPTATESSERAERSVKDIAATLSEDARWDSKRGAMVGRAVPVGLGKAVLVDEAFRKAVACSVRASAEMEIGEAEGRSGWIVEKIHPGTFNSVDFVTHAGRGGMILESARAALDNDIPAAFLRESAVAKIREARNIGQWIESRLHLELTQLADNMFGDGRLTREERIALSGAVGDALQAFVADLEKSAPQLYTRDLWADPAALAMAAETIRPARETAAADTEQAIQDAVGQAYSDADKETYSWLRDYDPDQKLAYFELSVAGACTTYQQAYTLADSGAVELTGDKTEVTRHITYVPTAESANPNVPVSPAGSTTTESEEDTMPQIEEAQMRTFEEAVGRVPVLEAELATEKSAREKAEHRAAIAEASGYARDFGTKRVKDANSELAPAVVEKIVADAMREIPLNESDNRLDTEAFGARVDEARKDQEIYLATVIENSAGTVRGLGPVGETKEVTRVDSQRAIDEAFGRQSKEG